MELENITFRRTRTNSNSCGILNDTMEDSFDSIPDMSTDGISETSKLITSLKNRIISLESELVTANQKIETLSEENNVLKNLNKQLQNNTEVNKQISSPSSKKSSSPIKSQKDIKKIAAIKTKKQIEILKPDSPKKLSHPQTKERCNICILSTNNRNKIIDIATTTFANHSENVSHYIKSHCYVERLIENIEAVLKTYTMKDFCIILIGEEDFKTTRDYFQLIFSIRTILQKVTHTNIIICSPTYQLNFYKGMYNWRVENFNNLLYLDVLTHEHAYFLDSNKHLSCDYSMFEKRTGLINNYGMQTIFKDIENLIHEIKKFHILNYNNNHATTEYIPDSELTQNQFFL